MAAEDKQRQRVREGWKPQTSNKIISKPEVEKITSVMMKRQVKGRMITTYFSFQGRITGNWLGLLQMSQQLISSVNNGPVAEVF